MHQKPIEALHKLILKSIPYGSKNIEEGKEIFVLTLDAALLSFNRKQRLVAPGPPGLEDTC